MDLKFKHEIHSCTKYVIFLYSFFFLQQKQKSKHKLITKYFKKHQFQQTWEFPYNCITRKDSHLEMQLFQISSENRNKFDKQDIFFFHFSKVLSKFFLTSFSIDFFFVFYKSQYNDEINKISNLAIDPRVFGSEDSGL